MIVRVAIFSCLVFLCSLSSGCEAFNIRGGGSMVELKQRAEQLEADGFLAEAVLFHRAVAKASAGEVASTARRNVDRIQLNMLAACALHNDDGDAYAKNGAWGKAKTSYLKAVAANPECQSAWSSLTSIEEKIALSDANRKSRRLVKTLATQDSLDGVSKN